jgi:hypothetical protein
MGTEGRKGEGSTQQGIVTALYNIITMCVHINRVTSLHTVKSLCILCSFFVHPCVHTFVQRYIGFG